MARAAHSNATPPVVPQARCTQRLGAASLDPLERLRHWSSVTPLRPAIWHKHRGACWKRWRWIDVLRDVERLAGGLRQLGLPPGTPLALCGDFDPDLVLLALAAGANGSEALVIPPRPDADALLHSRSPASTTPPRHLFVQRHADLPRWVEAARSLPHDLVLLTGTSFDPARSLPQFLTQPLTQPQPLSPNFPPHPPPRPSPNIMPLGELRGRESDAASECWSEHRPSWGWPPRTLWAEEGTEWPGGLSRLIDAWLRHGDGIAFPERRETASRDRRDVAATGLLMSRLARERLAEEIERSLPPTGSWRRRLLERHLAGDASPRIGSPRISKALGQLLGAEPFYLLRYCAPSGPAFAR